MTEFVSDDHEVPGEAASVAGPVGPIDVAVQVTAHTESVALVAEDVAIGDAAAQVRAGKEVRQVGSDRPAVRTRPGGPELVQHVSSIPASIGAGPTVVTVGVNAEIGDRQSHLRILEVLIADRGDEAGHVVDELRVGPELLTKLMVGLDRQFATVTVALVDGATDAPGL